MYLSFFFNVVVNAFCCPLLTPCFVRQLLVKEATQVAEQVMAMGRQHAMLETRHRMVESKCSILILFVFSLFWYNRLTANY